MRAWTSRAASAGRGHAVLPLLLALILSADSAAQNAASGAARAPRRTGSIAGRIIHPEGAAAEGARVAVYAVREGAAAAVVGTAISSYDGRYEVAGLPPGKFIVGVTPHRAGGFGGTQNRPPAVPIETLYPGVSDRDRAQPVTVFEGIATEGIDVWLSPAPQRFSISGRVYWPGNAAVEEVVIEYGGPDALRRGVWYVADPGGLFTLDGVAQGTYVLLARAETADGPLLGIAATDVSLGPVEDVRLTLRRPGSIEGRVVVEGGGPAAPTDLRITPVHMLLTLSPLYPVGETRVSGEGWFELHHLLGEFTLKVDGLPAGWRVRRVVGNGAALPANRVVVGAGERVTGLEIVVGPGTPSGVLQ